MNKSRAVLALALVLAIAAGWAAAWDYQQTNTELQESLRAHTEKAGLVAAQWEQQVRLLEKQLAHAKADVVAARAWAAERENQLAILTAQHAELQKLNEQANRRLQFSEEQLRLSRFETAEQLLGLPAVVLKEAHNEACVEAFKDSAGNPFYIGGPGASVEVAAFIQTLEDGKTYTLPAAFAEFQKKQKLRPPPNPPEAN